MLKMMDKNICNHNFYTSHFDYLDLFVYKIFPCVFLPFV